MENQEKSNSGDIKTSYLRFVLVEGIEHDQSDLPRSERGQCAVNMNKKLFGGPDWEQIMGAELNQSQGEMRRRMG